MLNFNILQTLKAKCHASSSTLIAASKTRTTAEITAAKNAGICHFGENYIQEAIDKIHTFKGCTLHFIGQLQSKKCKEAVKYFDYIHSVDRIKLANTLEKECVKQGRAQLKVFIQVNQGNETSKGGVSLNDLNSLILYIKGNCPHIELIGLMTIPPKDKPAQTYFKALQCLAKKHQLKETSMGMTGDYEDAIKNGATYIRVGTAIFGTR
ncbi:MAG: pyridoxal phosphate enzyme (YggS family) [Alphaproteobacteria bacterium]|jgi:pyridoxal phosphate enzyme (YggS family)